MGLLNSFAQNGLRCTPAATNLVNRSEGLAEPSGAIQLSCSGANPGTPITTNLTLTYNVPVTNRLNTMGFLDAVLSIDTGSGPAPSAVAPVPGNTSNNTLAFNSVAFTTPVSGAFALQITNVRLDVNAAGPGQAIVVNISTTLPLSSATVTVAAPTPGLLATYASSGINCFGSPLPATLNFTNLFNGGTIFSSTRVTEGFAAAFVPKDPTSDSGTRILLRYTNFPAGVRLFLPDFVAGSDTVQPTAAGDLGGTPAAGSYSPSAAGTLLLARVIGADATGMGGAPLSVAASLAPNTTFNSVSEVPLTAGAGTAVYEAIDSNPSVAENAQFPVFVGVPANQSPAVANESLSLAPVSQASTAGIGLPVPRFNGAPPPNDCQAVGDCGASYFPVLSITAPSLQFASPASGPFQTQYILVNNTAGGLLQFAFSVAYQGSASGWLTVTNESGSTNHTTLRVDANPANLAAGTYQATITINAGNAGTQSFPVTFTVGPPQVTILSVLNAASLQPGALVPGSLATIKGKNFTGKAVGVSFGGVPGTVIYSDAQQINVQIPASLASNTSTQVVVTVDGNSSAASTVALSSINPGIFGVLNQDNTVNSASNPAAGDTIIQIFATGLISAVSAGPVITGFGNQGIATVYSGAAPDGVQQVNARLPPSPLSSSMTLVVCGAGTSAQQVCSPPVELYVK